MAGGLFLRNTVLLFTAAVAVAWMFRLFRAPMVIGFLVTGMLIGPSALSVIRQEEVDTFAELGLALLLFTVGLELSPGPLLHSGRRLIVAALLQILGTALAAALLIQFRSSLGFGAAAILGLAIASSSTAIILGHLSQRGLTDSITGTIATGICLAQDVAVVALLLLLPLMGAPTSAGWLQVARRGLLSVGGLVVISWLARLVLPWVLDRLLARGGRELLTLFAVAAACAGAWLAGLAGWSWALGACIAGLLLAGSDVRHQLAANITPFRDVFNALFFISLGMLVDFRTVAAHPLALLAVIALTLVFKTVLASAAVLLAGWPFRVAIHMGLLFCTVSEFGYVLASEANRFGLLPDGWLQFVIAGAVGTMLAGAAIVPVAGDAAAFVVTRLFSRFDARRKSTEQAAQAEITGHVIVVGSGFTGQSLGRVLRATRIPHVVIEMNRGLASAAKKCGSRVVVGDATQRFILDRAGLGNARALVIVINDREATHRIVAQAHLARPDLYILARTHYLDELDVLFTIGARQVIAEEFESSIEIFAHVLKEFAIPENVVETEIAFVRAGRYAMLRGMPVTGTLPDLMRLLEKAATQTYYLEPQSPACGRTIREVNLRATTGVTIIAIVRAGRPTTNPPPDWRFEAADVLVLVGSHKQIDDAKAALAPPTA